MRAECRDSCARLDAHLSEELPAPERATLLVHLAACPDCAGELARRDRLRHELKAALGRPDQLEALEETILGAIAADRRRPRRTALAWAAAAAVIALFALRAASVSTYQESREAHVMCAVRPHYATPLRADRAAEGLGRYAALWPALEPELDGATLLSAHVCPHGARSYGHVVLERGGRRVSVLATDDGPDAPRQGVLAMERDGFLLAAAADRGRAAFVVSDLPPLEHLALGARMLPRVLEGLASAGARR